MANTARKDRKRLATTGERNPTKERTPKPRAKRKRPSGRQGGAKRGAAKPCLPTHERTAAAPKAPSAAPAR